MTLEELTTRLNLLQPLPDEALPSNAYPAAVLLPLLPSEQGLELILTRRSKALRHHPGQVCFPGGRADSSDVSLWHTALRESFEEIGLLPELCKPLAQLPAQHTISDFALTPFIGVIEGTPNFVLNPGEVTALYKVPLSYALDLHHHHVFKLRRKGRVHKVIFIRWQGIWIWGITAAIIHQLSLQIAP